MNWSEQELAEYLQRRGVPSNMPHVDVSAPPFKLPANQAGAFALGRLPIGTMNKTEAAYDAHLLELERAGEVLWRKFEAVKLRLADNTFYTPDFAVLPRCGVIELHEVKGGFWMDDAKVKIKVAAAIYPFRFISIVRLPKRDGGGWKQEEFS